MASTIFNLLIATAIWFVHLTAAESTLTIMEHDTDISTTTVVYKVPTTAKATDTVEHPAATTLRATVATTVSVTDTTTAVSTSTQLIRPLIVTLCRNANLQGGCRTKTLDMISQSETKCKRVEKNEKYGDKGSSFGFTDTFWKCVLYEDDNCLHDHMNDLPTRVLGYRASGEIFQPGVMDWDQDWDYSAYSCTLVAPK